MSTTSSQRRSGLAFAGTTALLWGFLPIVMRVGLDQVDVYTLVTFRFGLAAVLLAAYSAWKAPERLRVLRRPPLLILIAGVGLAVNYVCYVLGLESTSPATAQVVIQLAPPMLAGVGVVAFGERLARRQLLGALLVTSGFLLFVRDQLVGAGSDSSGWGLGVGWIVVAAASWVVYAALQKGLAARGFHPQEINLGVFALGALLVAPFSRPADLLSVDRTTWALMIYMGLNTLVAYGALAEALRRLPANEVGVIITLNPILTLLALAALEALGATWIAPEAIGWSGYLGAALVVLGVIEVVRGGSGRTTPLRPVPPAEDGRSDAAGLNREPGTGTRG